jgi:hypothetical protein
LSKHPEVVGHWHTLIEGFATSPLDFYKLVKASIAKRQIPALSIYSIEWKESGLGSGKRIYLRVSREGLNFDICAAPFGTGYFFSWWLAVIPRILLDFAVLFGIGLLGIILFCILARMGCAGMACAVALWVGIVLGTGAVIRYRDLGVEPTVLSMPVTGFVYGLIFRPVTYFNEDTALMFRAAVHHAVLEAIDQVTSAKGVKGLSEEARRITFKARGKE